MATEEHLPYYWAAYKLGCFEIVDDVFKQALSQEEFAEALNSFIAINHLTPYTFFAEVSGKIRAVGCGFFWVRGRIFQTENLIWFKWASKRIILESYVNFISKMRKLVYADTDKTYVILEYAREKDRPYFDHVCKYGVMHRVGTSYEIYHNEKCCIYESVGK